MIMFVIYTNYEVYYNCIGLKCFSLFILFVSICTNFMMTVLFVGSEMKAIEMVYNCDRNHDYH